MSWFDIARSSSMTEQPTKPPNFGKPDCQCQHCQQYRASGSPTEYLWHGPYLNAESLAKLHPQARNRQALLGDADYVEVAV